MVLQNLNEKIDDRFSSIHSLYHLLLSAIKNIEGCDTFN
jgi:hypothetical protein